MKLRTKFQDEDFELGEVVDVHIGTNANDGITLLARAAKGGLITFRYKSLEELNEEWEDYKEIKTLKIPELNLEIQLEDYKQGDKTEFTYYEAIELKLEDGWRLPTRHDWVMICEYLGNTKDGLLDRDKIVDTLKLTKNEDKLGFYWSSTAHSCADLAYNLFFNSSVVSPVANNYRGDRFTVRLVRDLEGEE